MSIVHHLFSFPTFSLFLLFFSMSGPPIWPGSPFYRKNKGVLLQGKSDASYRIYAELFLISLVRNVFLVPLTSPLYFPSRFSATRRRDLGLFAFSLNKPFSQQKLHIHVPGQFLKELTEWVFILLVCSGLNRAASDFPHFFSKWNLDAGNLSGVLCLSELSFSERFVQF